MAAPTLISYTETASWVTSGNPKSIASISWETGDVLVFLGLSETVATDFTWATPTNTGSGLTWAAQQTVTGSNIATAAIYTAVAAASSSGVITQTATGAAPGSLHWGFAVWVYRGSAGVGNSTQQSTATKTVSLTPTGADAAIVWGIADYGAGGALAGTPTSPTIVTRQSFDDGSSYSAGVYDMADQTSAGAVSYGGTGGGSTGPFSIVILEIKTGTSGTSAALTGTAATGARGSVAADLSGFTMSGRTGTSATGTQAPALSVPLVG